MDENLISWINPYDIPKAAHLLHHHDVWCVVNDRMEVAVYQLGTKLRSANSLQGNQNKTVAERLVDRYRPFGAVGVMFYSHVFLPDSPSRY